MNFSFSLHTGPTPSASAGGTAVTPNGGPAFQQGQPGSFLRRVLAKYWSKSGPGKNLLAFPHTPTSGQYPNQNDRQILDDPRDAWMLWFPRNLTVQQVVNILRASRMGDMWQLASLVEVMLDSWPMLKKCQHELRSAVSRTKFVAHPYAEKGKKPTAQAKAKADLVEKAMCSFRPDPRVTDEHGFDGMLYDLANAYLIGLTLVELQWHNVNGDLLPRASTFVHPAHIQLDDVAMIQIANAVSGETIPFNPNYFLSSVFQSQSGSAYAMGMVRSVGWWWATMLATQQWMFSSAQKHGSPYTFLTYARELVGNKVELDKIEESLNNAGANRWIMAPDGTEADLKPPGTMGQDNPQRYLKEQADKEVMQLFLGQTSSTNAEPGRLGNNDQHMEVRSERKEEVANWIGSILTEQWAPAILRRNFGEDGECPRVEPDLTEVETRLQTAQRVAAEINTGLPFVAEEVYDDLNRKIPEKGDLTVQRGQLGTMSDPAETPIQPTLEEQVEQAGMIAEASGQFEEPQGVQARGSTRATWSEESRKAALEARRKNAHGHLDNEPGLNMAGKKSDTGRFIKNPFHSVGDDEREKVEHVVRKLAEQKHGKDVDAVEVGRFVERHAKLTHVPLSELHSAQDLVKKDTVRHFVDNPDSHKEGQLQPTIAVRHQGKMYLSDGNHRMVARKLTGESHANILVFDTDSDTTHARESKTWIKLKQ